MAQAETEELAPLFDAAMAAFHGHETGAMLDAYLLRHIIHNWTDEQSIQILKNCRKVVPAHGKLLIVECVISADSQPSLAKDLDMTMMAMPGGTERSETEYRDLFEQANFELTGITPTSSEVNVIEGKPI